jgi:hypothetical protein
MHNVDVDALNQTIDQARRDPSAVVQQVTFEGEWNVGGGPQFRASIPGPNPIDLRTRIEVAGTRA